MREQENRLGNLTAFEAALASLAPRVDEFQRERLFFLAGQASVATNQGPRRSRWAQWGWPAAFSAMTATAGCLLVMLCTRTAPNGAVQTAQALPPGAMVPAVAGDVAAVETPPSPSPPAVEEAVAGGFGGIARVLAAWLPQWPATQPQAGRGLWSRDLAYAAADGELRRQVPWQRSQSRLPAAPVAAAAATAPEEPLPYRELLERLLEEQAAGALLPHAPSKVINGTNL